jgi:hypothetical protein
MMTATILDLLRHTAQTWRVRLSCGHTRIIITTDDLSRPQWYIGRLVRCGECEPATG